MQPFLLKVQSELTRTVRRRSGVCSLGGEVLGGHGLIPTDSSRGSALGMGGRCVYIFRPYNNYPVNRLQTYGEIMYTLGTVLWTGERVRAHAPSHPKFTCFTYVSVHFD